MTTITGIEDGIAEALLWHMSQYSTALDIAYPNVHFTPTGNYLEVELEPNIVRQSSFGTNGYNRHRGLIQINVHWKRGEGLVAPTAIATSLAAHWKRGTAIVRNSLTIRTDPPRIAGAITKPESLMIPVIIPWFTDTLKA